jgi:tRNA threonylcarbamoyladenosine biosynthesis protein TsaE
MKEFIASENQLSVVVQYLIEVLPKNALIFLRGDLAAGKTTLTKHILALKGIQEGVTSPTFSLQQCYGDEMFHYDLYRIENEEFMELGLFEEFDKEGWHFIEWGDDALRTFLENIGYEIFTVNITAYEEKRKYRSEKS